MDAGTDGAEANDDVDEGGDFFAGSRPAAEVGEVEDLSELRLGGRDSL